MNSEEFKQQLFLLSSILFSFITVRNTKHKHPYLRSLEDESIHIIREAVAESENPVPLPTLLFGRYPAMPVRRVYFFYFFNVLGYLAGSYAGRAAPGKGRCCSCLSLLVQRKAHKERTPPQSPAGACARNSPLQLCWRRLRQARAADVLPDVVCISICSLCFSVWHSYTLLWCGLCAARLTTRTPCSDSVRRSGFG